MAAMLHPFARMGITTMRRMPARLTASTDRIGSLAACLSEQDLGSTAFMAVVDTGAEAASVDAVGLEAADLRVADSPDVGASTADVEALAAGVAASAAAVTSTAAVAFTAVVVAVDSTAAVAVDSTAVAEATAAVGTGN
jgi:hypothetical protein